MWAPFRSLVCIVAAGRISLAGKCSRVSPQCSQNRCIHFFAAALRAEALMKDTHLRHTDLPLFRFLVVYRNLDICHTWKPGVKEVPETMREAHCTTREGRGKNWRSGRMHVRVRKLGYAQGLKGSKITPSKLSEMIPPIFIFDNSTNAQCVEA